MRNDAEAWKNGQFGLLHTTVLELIFIPTPKREFFKVIEALRGEEALMKQGGWL